MMPLIHPSMMDGFNGDGVIKFANVRYQHGNQQNRIYQFFAEKQRLQFLFNK